VQSLSDPRIKYYRTQSFIPVTDNWNNALEKSSGDYVIMLGDDDCLMKGYFTSIGELIEKYNSPDFIYTSAFNYAYPGVMPGFPHGFLQPYGYASFLQDVEEPFWLDKDKALELVKLSMNFKLVFGYNMQFAVISRKLIDRLQQKGQFFQSPYPDYYAMNAMLLKGERILVFPKPMVTIGISPKSFGFYYFNESEQSGVEFLKNLPDKDVLNKVQDVILPGTNMNTSWLLSMETIKRNYGAEFDLRVDYSQYRLLQVLQVFARYSMDKQQAMADFVKLWKLMSAKERLMYGAGLRILCNVIALLPKKLRKKVMNRLIASVGTYPQYNPKRIEGQFANILDVFEKIDPHLYSNESAT
jgi:hypothetical protein